MRAYRLMLPSFILLRAVSLFIFHRLLRAVILIHTFQIAKMEVKSLRSAKPSLKALEMFELENQRREESKDPEFNELEKTP